MKIMKIQRLTQCISLAAASIVLSGAVFAADKPAELSDTQLDNVTAGNMSNNLGRSSAGANVSRSAASANVDRSAAGANASRPSAGVNVSRSAARR